MSIFAHFYSRQHSIVTIKKKTGLWVALHVDKNCIGTFFDSFGLEPWGKIATFFEKNAKYTIFNKTLLQIDETSCGYHVLFFLEQMDKDKNISDVLDIYKKHSFSSHDEMVAAFYMRRCKKIKSFENPHLLCPTE